jgi:hypothetical protein
MKTPHKNLIMLVKSRKLKREQEKVNKELAFK